MAKINRDVDADLARKYAETSAGKHEEELQTDANNRYWGDVTATTEQPRSDSHESSVQSLFGGKNPA